MPEIVRGHRGLTCLPGRPPSSWMRRRRRAGRNVRPYQAGTAEPHCALAGEILACDHVVLHLAGQRHGGVDCILRHQPAPLAGAVGAGDTTAASQKRRELAVHVVDGCASHCVPSVPHLREPALIHDLQWDRARTIAQAGAVRWIALVVVLAATIQIGTDRRTCRMIEHDLAPATGLALRRNLAVAPLVVGPVGELGVYAEASAAHGRTTDIDALRRIHLARLAALVPEIVRDSASARRIAVVLLQRRAHEVHTERSTRMVVEDHLALLLWFLRPFAYAPLYMVPLGRLGLRRGALATLGFAPVVIAGRFVRLGNLAELVVEHVLR